MGPALLSPGAGLVLDASVAISWCLPDESNTYADGIIARLSTEPGHVPQIWAIEVANSLAIGLRRNRYEQSSLPRLLADLSSLNIAEHVLPRNDVWNRLILVATTHALSVYDASYIELAERLQLPLATLDLRLQSAATGAGIPLA